MIYFGKSPNIDLHQHGLGFSDYLPTEKLHALRGVKAGFLKLRGV